MAVYSILSCFSKLCFPQSNWMLSAVFDEPPFDQGIIWSKCRSSVAPHFAHLPPSLFQTPSLTAVGITRLVLELVGTGMEKSSSPSTALSLNLKTLRPPFCSCHESTKWKTPLYDQMPCFIFSYTRTRSGGRSPTLNSCAALWNLPFSVKLPDGVYSG